MEAVVGIFIGLAILGGLYYFVFRKKKDQPKEVKGFKEYNLKVANLTAEGKIQDRDFVVAIIGLPEFKSKTPQQIEDWIKEKVGKEGTLSNYDAVLGLQELTYTTTDKTIDVFFLIVEETSQNVIDWKEPKPETPTEPTPEPIEKVISVKDSGDNTAYLRASFKQDDTKYVFPENTRAFASGILESDEPNKYGLKLGEHGIVLLEGRKNIEIDGKGATLWNDEAAVDVNDGLKPTLGTRSELKFIKIRNSEAVHIHDLNIESWNNIHDEYPNRPAYFERTEFEHGVDIADSKKVALENMHIKNVGGDGTYIRDSHDIFMKNVTVDGNGRQGGAMVSGGRAYLENCDVLNSRRSGYDIEGNNNNNDSDGFVITYSTFNNHLLGLPMGGMGFVKNVLCINNIYENAGIYSKGNGTNRQRENIMFVRCELIALGDYYHTKNILIDGIKQPLGRKRRSIILGKFSSCKNVTIRNVDIPNYGWKQSAEEDFFLVDSYNSDFKIYNNKQKIGVRETSRTVRADQVEPGKFYYVADAKNTNFKNLDPNAYEIVKPTRPATIDDFIIKDETNTLENLGLLYPIEFPEYTPTEEEAVSIPFETNNPWIDMHWERLYTNGTGYKKENYVDDGWRPDWLTNMKQ